MAWWIIFVIAIIAALAIYGISMLFPEFGAWLNRVLTTVGICIAILAIIALVTGQYWLITWIFEVGLTGATVDAVAMTVVIEGTSFTFAQAAWLLVATEVLGFMMSYALDPDAAGESMAQVAEAAGTLANGVGETVGNVIGGVTSGLVGGLASSTGLGSLLLLAGLGLAGYYLLTRDDKTVTISTPKEA